ncbi:MAG: helix-turn-helix domain-containing protein [Planctomycetes bacterium]|nr:helix-turn-helix domain-containing protein [Planctomycetota bacterium]
MDTNHAILPLNEMAARLRVTNAWLRGEADAGRVPHLKAGTRYLFHPAAVERVISARAAGEAGAQS